MTSTSHLSSGFSGALRTFAFWVASGTLGQPLLEGIDYWDDLRESPSLMEQAFAIFANVIELDADGNPANAKHAERRAAMWIRQYMTGEPADPPFEGWEVALYPPPPRHDPAPPAGPMVGTRGDR